MFIPTFTDENDNELSFYRNVDDMLYIQIKDLSTDEFNWIAIDKEDLLVVIEHLKRIQEEVI